MSRDRPEDFLLIWVVGGHGWARTEDHHTEAGPGTLLTFAKGRPQAYGSSTDRPWHILWVHWGGPDAAAWFEALRNGQGPARRLGLAASVRRAFEQLLDIHALAHADARRLSDTMLVSLLGWMRYHLARPEAAGADRADIGPAVQRYVRDHLAKPIRVEDLARHVSLSPRQLARLMRQTLGASPMDYVIRQRLAHAATLLAETSLPIKQIADAVGYDDPLYFSRLFTRKMGRSPVAYRRRPHMEV